jgi:hypothetical protein
VGARSGAGKIGIGGIYWAHMSATIEAVLAADWTAAEQSMSQPIMHRVEGKPRLIG